MKRSRVESEFSDVVLLIYQLSGCLPLVPKFKVLASINKESVYSKQHFAAEETISKWADQLLIVINLKIKKSIIEILLWIIYTTAMDYGEPIEKMYIKSIRIAYIKIFKKGILERVKRNKEFSKKDADKCLNIFETVLNCLEDQNKLECDNKSKSGNEKNKEQTDFAFVFHKNAQNYKYYELNSLVFLEYFNQRTLKNIDEEIANKKVSDNTAKSNFAEFPPLLTFIITPIAICNKILYISEVKNIEMSKVGPNKFWRAMESYCREKEHVDSTINKDKREFDKIVELVEKDGHSVWGVEEDDDDSNDEDILDNEEAQEMIKEGYNDLIDIDEDNYAEIRQFNLHFGEEFESTDCGIVDIEAYYDQSKLTFEEFIQKRLEIIIAENRHDFSIEGGLLRLIYRWSNSFVIPYDSICVFLGELQKKSQHDPDCKLLLQCVLECLLTGASVRNIIYGRIEYPQGNIKVKPACLYMTSLEMSGNFQINKEEHMNKLIKIIKEFNKKYKIFSISLGRLLYTARAWHIDKTKSLSACELSHISGLLPYTLSDLQYIQPKNLIRDLYTSNTIYLDQLLSFATGTYKYRNKFPQEIYEIIDHAVIAINDEKSKLNKKTKTRKDIWELKKPKILFTDTDLIYSIINLLHKRLDNPATIQEWFILVEAITMFFDFVILAMRKSEEPNVNNEGISEEYKTIITEAKDSRGFIEIRVMPDPVILFKIQKTYKSLRDELYSLSIITCSAEEKKMFYMKSKESLKLLKEIILEATGFKNGIDALRKYSINKLHNEQVKNKKCDYMLMQWLINHIYAGHIPFGAFDFISFSRKKAVMKEHAKAFASDIKEFVRRINRERKRRLSQKP